MRGHVGEVLVRTARTRAGLATAALRLSHTYAFGHPAEENFSAATWAFNSVRGSFWLRLAQAEG